MKVKTGKARLVTPKTIKCKKRERLVKIIIPQIDESLISVVHSGSGAPIDFTIGHDGDFYLDTDALIESTDASGSVLGIPGTILTVSQVG